MAQTVILAARPGATVAGLIFDKEGRCAVTAEEWVKVHEHATIAGVRVVRIEGANVGIGRMTLEDATGVAR